MGGPLWPPRIQYYLPGHSPPGTASPWSWKLQHSGDVLPLPPAVLSHSHPFWGEWRRRQSNLCTLEGSAKLATENEKWNHRAIDFSWHLVP